MRRIPLLVDVVFYSLVGFLSAFAPNFTVLVILRILYEIGMGGEWGLGAATEMEKIPMFILVPAGKETKGIEFGGRLGT